MAEHKTNAMRLLDKAGIRYRVWNYDPGDGNIHGTAVAAKIGKPPETVFKTLVAHQGASLFVYVIPVGSELDLKQAAKAAGAKKIEMLPVKDLLKHTGYIRGGCSPVGMKKLYPTYIDDSAMKLETILVSAGKIGLQVELEPASLAAQVSAKYAPLAKRGAGEAASN
ncbi:Cys-tRNA(Pro) deacylase [Paenibacillus thailandensis]|uniref:Cys-tRNA(Pro)/Cys-tRNA(Cys) deacylase n=1 Tax=Paenibacillus thailandensis TaxID=393250 RepID=A0ABW5QTF0_9BACL